MLSRHILPENLIEAANKHAHKGHTHRQTTTSSYGSRYESQVEVPKFRIPPQGCPANQAYQLIHDMTELDGRVGAVTFHRQKARD
jgi:glutamate decarboxylase